MRRLRRPDHKDTYDWSTAGSPKEECIQNFVNSGLQVNIRNVMYILAIFSDFYIRKVLVRWGFKTKRFKKGLAEHPGEASKTSRGEKIREKRIVP